MRHTTLGGIIGLVSTGLMANAQSVSLSKFTPTVNNLPADCQSAYTAPIDGCTKDDFPQLRNNNINNCSPACVDGLVKIVTLVNQKCMGVRVPSDSIIGHALLGDLLPQLCGSIVVVTESRSSTTSTTSRISTQTSTPTTQSTSSIRSSTVVQSSSSRTTDTTIKSTTSSPERTTSTETPVSITSPGLTLNTNTEPPPSAAQTGVPQKSNPDSGGGSPFDIVISNSASHIKVGGVTITSILCAIAGLVLFL